MIAWLLSILLAALIYMLMALYDAPEGYEDENGFHFGKPTDRDR